MKLTLIGAQQRYIDRVNGAFNRSTGHARRVNRAAWNQLRLWLLARGYDVFAVVAICNDARDMALLERRSDE